MQEVLELFANHGVRDIVRIIRSDNFWPVHARKQGVQSYMQDPKPIITAFEQFYEITRELSWLVVRVTAGGILLVHGLQKVIGSSIAGFAANSLARRGLEPSVLGAYIVFFLETVGAICIILGLFTRLFVALVFIEFLVIIFVAQSAGGLAGFPWTKGATGGGWEYPLFWELIWVAILMRGGGPYSLDRKLRREL
jgi:putative oxidoreductase